MLRSVAFFSAGVLVGTEHCEYAPDGILVRIGRHGANDVLKSYIVIEHASAAELVSQ